MLTWVSKVRHCFRTLGFHSAGQKLPSVRQLAKDLQVAAGTVMRAYTELEADGLIETRPGSTARVRAGHELPEAVRNPVCALIATAHQQGMSMSDTIDAVQALWTEESENPSLMAHAVT
ncbi:DNA-binding transcriptional regulator YhcF, GntR family [Propionibacterium cyclohexanicum]|uniref:DNA-binding transcriptional regulator YhcF, GntR family n=1 Tax=Propionibacterium cyclohexanicum TaxID=64702 RepID=A0A1H9U0I3_9ACTN|nr:GntR family transcriptional regulator [Propionibacterium cyclohexanicum]SES02677.1 DNA-binding transcriptional regulator YhcF, GntR family [Propionibacterium cyclohexanicum]